MGPRAAKRVFFESRSCLGPLPPCSMDWDGCYDHFGVPPLVFIQCCTTLNTRLATKVRCACKVVPGAGQISAFSIVASPVL
jgi:hypothetical protein